MEKQSPLPDQLQAELEMRRNAQDGYGFWAGVLSITSAIPAIRASLEFSNGYRGVSEMVITAGGLMLAGLLAHKSIAEENAADAIEQTYRQQTQ
jgi:hypothetical protein